MKKSELKTLIREEIKKIIEGKQVGPLYHYTRTESLINILKRDTLNSSKRGSRHKDRQNEPNYISFSRTSNKSQFDIADSADCVIIIDGNKLSNRYKIEPYHDSSWDNDSQQDEMEERIYTKNIPNFKPYIKKIIFYENYYDGEQNEKEEWWDKAVEVVKSLNIPFEIKGHDQNKVEKHHDKYKEYYNTKYK